MGYWLSFVELELGRSHLSVYPVGWVGAGLGDRHEQQSRQPGDDLEVIVLEVIVVKQACERVPVTGIDEAMYGRRPHDAVLHRPVVIAVIMSSRSGHADLDLASPHHLHEQVNEPGIEVPSEVDPRDTSVTTCGTASPGKRASDVALSRRPLGHLVRQPGGRQRSCQVRGDIWTATLATLRRPR